MITTKYNFKLWLHKKYPSVTATPIYGIPAYILSKPLSDEDNFKYNVQTMKDGRYVVFIGMSIVDAQEALSKLNTGRAPIVREYSKAAPTTFSAFEQWLNRNHIVANNRTFCNHMSASQALMTNDIHNCIDIDAIRTWYMYELPYSEDHAELYQKVPYITATNKNGTRIIIALVKACNSTYKSKRTLFSEKFSLMQPIYEQLLVSAAKAEARDEVQPGTGDWQVVKQLCEHYMSIQFESTGTINIDKLKEAVHDGVLGMWVRNRSNFQSNEENDF